MFKILLITLIPVFSSAESSSLPQLPYSASNKVGDCFKMSNDKNGLTQIKIVGVKDKSYKLKLFFVMDAQKTQEVDLGWVANNVKNKEWTKIKCPSDSIYD